jgi:hypothetical protein
LPLWLNLLPPMPESCRASLKASRNSRLSLSSKAIYFFLEICVYKYHIVYLSGENDGYKSVTKIF